MTIFHAASRAAWLLALLFSAVTTFASGRKTCIDQGWRFHYGAAPEATSPDYDDSSWRLLDLPHDWSVETEAAAAAGEHVGPFSKMGPGGSSLGYQNAQTIGGEGWYRRRFTLTDADMKGEILLYLEGAYNHSEVYLNGRKLAFNPYGYMSFRVDITDACRPAGQENVIAVRVTNVGNNTRWYAGSGIYRHVWLIRRPRLHLDSWHTFIKTLSADAGKAHISVSSTLFNDTPTRQRARLSVTILSPDGRVVATGKRTATIDPTAETADTVLLHIDQPALWSPETPALYRAVITLTGPKGLRDELRIAFGIRTLRWNATEGFVLNGKSIKLRGGCVHHDHGLLGAASYDKAEERKVSLLKQYGYNAVRCSHNIPAEHFLHACDSIGLLVLDEAFDQWLVAKNKDDYHLWFADYSTRDIQAMVRRDRNHPSVIFWGIGNEIPGRIEPSGMEAARRLRADILALDDSRPITAAISDWDSPSHSWDEESAKAFQSLDIGGYNYMYGHYEKDHERYPDRVMMGTESYPLQASENWALVEKHPYVIGDFVWTAMDYVGEAGIGHSEIVDAGKQTAWFRPWPWFNGWCGDIDLIGGKKPQSYYRDVVWHLRPITMAVKAPIPAGKTESVSLWGWPDERQSWTWPGRTETDTMAVHVYSRAPEVRLFLNDTLIGMRQTSADFRAVFALPYRPGTLRAVAVDNGKEGDSFQLSTTTAPVALRLKADTAALRATGSDLGYVVVELIDAAGRVVDDSNRQIHFSVAGAGQLLAGGNASPTDQSSFRSASPRLFRGRALAIVKSGTSAGRATLTVTSDGLAPQKVVFDVSR